MERRHVSEARVTLARSIVGAALGARAVVCNAGPAPGAPIRTRLLRSPTNRPARVAQSSAQRVDEADAGRAPRGPRFARFAAAMVAAAASQDQLFARSQHRIRAAETVNTSARIQWLGIGSWALFCAALFVTLLLPSERASLNLDRIQPRALVSNVRSIAESTLRRLLPTHGQEAVSTSPTTAPELDARPADRGTRAGPEADRQ